MDLLIELERPGRRRSLEDALRTAIQVGRLAPGDQLPSTRTLAAELGLARGTVMDAVAQLATEGYVITRQGRPTVVAALPAARTPHPEPPPPRPCSHDLRPGAPEPGTFPIHAWIAAIRRATREAPDDVLDYGDPRGRPELRQVVAAYLRRARGVVADPDHVVICAGFAHGLDVLSRALRCTGSGTVAMEDPGLRFHRDIVAQAGLNVIAARVDERGATVPTDAADALVVTPAHQYPLGITMGSQRRRSLVAWAREHERWLIEDDYDGEFRFDRRPIGALQGLDPECVVFAGTTSKSLAPGIRIGWIVVPRGLLEPVLEVIRLRDPTPAIDQLGLAEVIRSGRFDRHIRRMRERYRDRLTELRQLLRSHGLADQWSGTSAGLHVHVPIPCDTEGDMLQAAQNRSLALEGLGSYWHRRRQHDGLVLGFARPPAHSYRAALDALGATLADVLGPPA